MYFLNINKPKGITSFDVIRVLRKKLKIREIGHSGTLDPLASGVMQIGVGYCTKLINFLESDKTYIANVKFGYTSSTMDDEGDKIFISKPNFSYSLLEQHLKSFLGNSMQVPPKFSAIKINGKRACDIAREDPSAIINLKQRKIEIYDLSVLYFDSNSAKIKIHCSKGTYIRSLVNDLGKRLDCGAYLTDLVRVKAGKFSIENADDLNSDSYNNISPLDALSFDKYEVNDDQYLRTMNGCQIEIENNIKGEYVLLTKHNKLVSIGILSDNSINDKFKIVRPKKNFKEV